MAEDPEFDPEDSGARKSFWEHVQDLRTALIRSVIALGVAVMICLLITPQIVSILEYPLKRMHMFEVAKPSVTLELGTTKLGPFPVSREQFAALPPTPSRNNRPSRLRNATSSAASCSMAARSMDFAIEATS